MIEIRSTGQQLCFVVLVLLFLPLSLAASEQRPNTAARIKIVGGRFTPLFGLTKNTTSVLVAPFSIDAIPVTNISFKQFIDLHPEWQKDAVSRLLADRGYLGKWRRMDNGTWVPPAGEEQQPVTAVSWFAAHAYCESKGGRLPTVNEWEFVGAASETSPNAMRDPKFVEQLLAWYSTPNNSRTRNDVGESAPNFYGIYDLHGLVWEWNEDFNSVFVTGDNRADADDMKNLFCGAGAAGSADRSDYAAFMRYALRNSLRANYTLNNVGFRCAYDNKK